MRKLTTAAARLWRGRCVASAIPADAGNKSFALGWGAPEFGDLDVPAQVRIERLYGIDASPLVDVDIPNSVVNRLFRPLVTPAERLFGFVHALDALMPRAHECA